MRSVGFTLAALLIGITVASGQQPPGPPPVAGAPVGAPGRPAAPPADPKLDAHLAGWEKTMTTVTSFKFDLALTKTEPVFKTERKYSGQVTCMKPNFAVLRLDYEKDRKDYAAYICDGKSVYEYNGLAKTITEWKLPDLTKNPGGDMGNLMIDFLSGMKVKDAKARFDLKLEKEDANYVYLDVKPILAKDKGEFQQLRLALYGPNTRLAYIPALVYLVTPKGDIEQWEFKKPELNVQGLTMKHFQFQDVPGFTKQVGQPPAPPPPPMRPGQPQLPGAGGVPPGPGIVRPGKP